VDRRPGCLRDVRGVGPTARSEGAAPRPAPARMNALDMPPLAVMVDDEGSRCCRPAQRDRAGGRARLRDRPDLGREAVGELMLLLATTGHPDIAERFAHPNLGRLLQPRHTSSAEATARAGLPWAADNDCFQGLHEQRFLKMLDRIADLPGCLFVSCPDVVGDHAQTLELWHEWSPHDRAAGQPAAFVLQDGATGTRCHLRCRCSSAAPRVQARRRVRRPRAVREI
jgi:hypothetical protein